MPTAPATLAYNPETGHFRWTVTACPFCAGRHSHGAGPFSGNPRDRLGQRVPHCHVGGAEYRLTEANPRQTRAMLKRLGHWLTRPPRKRKAKPKPTRRAKRAPTPSGKSRPRRIKRRRPRTATQATAALQRHTECMQRRTEAGGSDYPGRARDARRLTELQRQHDAAIAREAATEWQGTAGESVLL